MYRRHFIKIAATAGAAVVFSRLTALANPAQALINIPDKVLAKSGGEWHVLTASNGSTYTYKDVRVRLKTDGGALSVFASSPTMPLEAVKLQWNYDLPPMAKVLGDKWERSYGDLGWNLLDSESRQPWHFLMDDGKDIACFGVKTGCNALCSWFFASNMLELVLDTTCGGGWRRIGPERTACG